MVQIQVGNTIPAQSVKENAADATSPLVLKGKNIIVGVPGAFTGVCHAQVPGYVQKYDEFKAKGVSEIYIFAVNDVFVMKAWKNEIAPAGTNVHFIADDKGNFAKSVGLDFDASPLLGGIRSKRYVIVTDDDKVLSIAVEENPGQLTITSAENVLAQL